MVVLHIVAPGEIGGLERVVQMLAQGQAEAGAQVHVALVAAAATHPLGTALAAAGVTPHAIAVAGRAYWRERAAVVELCRRLQPDVVHTHGARPDVVDAPVARQLGIPTVTTVHGFCGGDWKNRLYERFQRRAFRSFDAVVGVSHPLRERLLRDRVPPARIHVVQNAWQETAPPFDRGAARETLGVPGDGFRVGWVGRLSREKAPDVLLDALPHLSDQPVDVSFVGNGGEQPALVARARRLGVERQVRWHGTIPEMARLFAAFDVLVLSSRTEGTPIVLFEAMAAGVPIVATRVGGVPDVVSPAQALLVPPDEPALLAAAIREVLGDPEQARARAQRARARLLDFTVAPWVSRYGAIYRLVTEQATAAVVTA